MIDLADERIFGNDAGDDEDIELLNRYFVEQVSFNRFYDQSVPFRIVTARKGTGKSALLRRAKALADNFAAKNITLSVKGADIRPDVSDPSVAANLIDAWKQRICTRINREIGSKIKIAAGDDSITLVEASELDGFRERNIVSALADRIKLKIEAGAAKLELGKIAAVNDPALLERFSREGDYTFWLFVDDIDATFRNNLEDKALIAAFFSACRDMVQRVNGLVIRCSVRTDVWTIAHGFDESLDKCEQYVFNLRWDVIGVENILLKKVKAYFDLFAPDELGTGARELDAFHAVFPRTFQWGRDGGISSQKYLSIFSQGRPRWTSKLCRAAALRAAKNGHVKVEESDLRSELIRYSLRRRQDLVGEHSYEYAEFNSLLQIFHRWQKRFKTSDLLRRIVELHIKKMPGQGEKPDPVVLAHLLYRAGFMNAARQRRDGKSEYFEFEDRPGLLTSRGDLDEGCEWEIPMFLRKEFDV